MRSAASSAGRVSAILARCSGSRSSTSSALIEAVEADEVQRILIYRVERLGTSSAMLEALACLLRERQVRIAADPAQLRNVTDPGERFAISILHDCFDLDTEADKERKEQLRRKKLQEIERLRARLSRLENELREIDSPEPAL